MRTPKKNIETPHDPDLEEDSNTDETEDVDLFVQKIQLHNRVLKKITEELIQKARDDNEDKNPNPESTKNK